MPTRLGPVHYRTRHPGWDNLTVGWLPCLVAALATAKAGTVFPPCTVFWAPAPRHLPCTVFGLLPLGTCSHWFGARKRVICSEREVAAPPEVPEIPTPELPSALSARCGSSTLVSNSKHGRRRDSCIAKASPPDRLWAPYAL